MSKITLFSAPKPFTDTHINIIQQNAIRSWKALGADVDILLIGDEPGMEEAAREIGVKFIPEVARNDFGTPLVHSIFNQARESSEGEILLYVNADIILLPEILDVITKIKKLEEDYLLVGRRWDLSISGRIDFTKDWIPSITDKLRREGKLRAPTAIDYFIFPRHLYNEVPPFAIGRAGWDNWMIYHGMGQPWPVIDVTPSLRVVHQNHDYSHLPGGKPHYDLEESNQNVSLSGGMKTLYDLLDVNLILKDGRILPKGFSLPRGLRKMERLVIPEEKEGWRWSLTRILRKSRKRISKLYKNK
jgi:hypothetical protein